jgi:CheY-like chemotaxis protein
MLWCAGAFLRLRMTSSALLFIVHPSSFILDAAGHYNCLVCKPMVGPKGRVLVVDDEPAIRALVTKIVERAGHPVVGARDGADAIEKLEQDEYAVIVLDLNMPNVDGYALIEHIKERNGRRPAIIVISAGDTAALRRLDGSVVHSILRKPFDIDVLGDLISAAARASDEEMAKEEKTRAEVLPFRKIDPAG